MSKRAQKNYKHTSSKAQSSPGKNVFLALTLVPLVIGIILIGAWALDLDLLGDPQSQITVGVFFFLVTFTLSNAIQKRWRLAAGWGVLAVADLVTLAWLNLGAQIVAIGAALVGVVLIGIEFYRQYRQGKAKNGKPKK